MGSKYYTRAVELLQKEPGYKSNDLASLARLNAYYSNLFYYMAEAGIKKEECELLDTVLFCIRVQIVNAVMKNEGYFLNEELTISQWEKS